MKTPSACSCCMQCTLSGRKVREVCRRRPAQLAQHSSCTLQAARPSKCSAGSHHCRLKQHVQATLAGARSLMIPWCFLRYFFFFSSFLFLRWKNGENEVNICFKMLHDLHQVGCELTMITLQKDGETVDRHAKDRCEKHRDKRQHGTGGCLGKYKAETALIELRQKTEQDKKGYDMSTRTAVGSIALGYLTPDSRNFCQHFSATVKKSSISVHE